MHFGEFNPLDVLAAAAVQHSGTPNDTNDSEESEEIAGEDESEAAATTSEVVMVANESAPEVITTNKPLALLSPLNTDCLSQRTMVTTTPSTSAKAVPNKEATTKIVIPNKNGSSKTLTVLKMNSKSSTGEHTYAYLCPVDKNKMEDDEGYCSRSSLDSPGQSSRSDSDAFEQESVFEQRSPIARIKRGPMSPPPPPRVTSPRPNLIKAPTTKTIASSSSPNVVARTVYVTSPTITSPVTQVVSSAKKQPPSKIVIVSRDKKTEGLKTDRNGTESGVLRSLLGQSSKEKESENNKTETSADVRSDSVEDSAKESIEQSDSGDIKQKEQLQNEATESNNDQTASLITNKSDKNIENKSSPGKQLVSENKTKSENTEEEIIDVTSCEDNKPLLTTTTSTSVPIVASLAPIKAATTTSVSSLTLLPDPSKRVPLLINTSLGHRVATLPSTSAPVTYLLVPPPQKKGTGSAASGLVISQLPTVNKNQYIIQDDLPPPTKINAAQKRTAKDNKVSVLGALNKKGGVISSTAGKPLLLSKPLTPSKSTGALLCIDANTGRPLLTSPTQLALRNSSTSSSQLINASLITSSASSLTSSSSIVKSSSSNTLQSLENNEKQINIKISGSKVIDMNKAEDISTPAKKATTSIGNIGSLSLTKIDNNLSPVSPLSRTVSPLSAASTNSFSPVGSGPTSRSHTPLDFFISNDVVTPDSPGAAHSNKTNMSARTCHTYVKRKQSTSSNGTVKIKEDLGVRLHPLIDHDYCMFTEFSAEIQSSIIATTESKLKTERKYSKKTKAARTKVLRTPPPEKGQGRKKRKYTRRIPLEKIRQKSTDSSIALAVESPSSVDSIESPTELLPSIQTTKPESPMETKKTRTQQDNSKTIGKQKSPSKRREGRNYVKITGSYQDEFVYFATKKTSGRPRKYHDSVVSGAQTDAPPNPTPTQQPPATVAGINVFDWYRDLSNTDKSSRFGMESDKLEPPSIPVQGRTPEHDSEVVDLVMEMSEDTGYNIPETGLESFNSFVDTDSLQSETVITTPSEETKPLPGENNEDSDKNSDKSISTASTPISSTSVVSTTSSLDSRVITTTAITSDTSSLDNSSTIDTGSTSIPDCQIDEAMVEEVRTMLNSMGEAELKMLSEDLSSAASQHQSVDIKPSEEGTGLNAFLASYTPDCTQSQTTEAAFDLYDINDSDLLPLSDLTSRNKLVTSTSTASTVCNSKQSKLKDSTLNMLFTDSSHSSDSPLKTFPEDDVDKDPPQSDNFADKLDRSELFPDITQQAASPQPSQQMEYSSNTVGNSAPPELTVVSMYWNDLPGLMINNKQFVRLVDIHKQMLPAKDTGILKKRCQMMNLEIVNCSELQRDFLVRYANAAKSKSTVVITKDDAETLVSFYVDPRPRAPRQASLDEVDQDTGFKPEVPKSEGGKVKLKIKLRNGEVKQELPSEEQPEKGLGKTKRSVKRRQPSVSSQCSVENESKRSTGRTRNRKVNYAALHSGSYPGTIASPAESIPHVLMPTNTAVIEEIQPIVKPLQADNQQPPVRVMFPEEREIRRLRNKQKKRPLMRKDREKLKRLRDKLRRKLRKLRNEMDKVRASKKPVVPTAVFEDCVKPEVAVIVEDVPATEFIEVVSPGPSPDGINDTQEEMKCEEQKTPEVKIEDDTELAEENSPNDIPCILVLHRDNTARSRGGRQQEGYLDLNLYTSREAACIKCCTCSEQFSVKKFIKHLHHHNKVDELCQVSLVQKLEPKCPAPMLTWQIWEQFEKKQQIYDAVKQVKQIKPQPTDDESQQRQSGRVRKRKQLHPMESYVYSAENSKRGKFEDSNTTVDHTPDNRLTKQEEKMR